PAIGLSLFVGTLSDRLERRQLMVVSQATLVAGTALMALGIFAGWLNIVLAILLSTLISVFTQTNIMVRQAMVGDLLPAEDFMPGMFLYSAGLNSARAVGPLVAGTLIATIGTGFAYTLQAGFWLVACILTAGMARVAQKRPRKQEPLLRSSWQGITFVAR